MNRNNFTRRQAIAAGIAGVGLAAPVPAADPPTADLPPKNAAEALDRLKAGNARFAAGRTRHAHEGADWRKHLVADQKPFATVLGCSDSRVPPELVFDQGFGDLFVIRVAGNVIAPDVVGSLAYALEHLRTPLVVVLGHQGCGAVTAALDALSDPAHKEVPAIASLLKLIDPALKGVDMKRPKAERVSAGVEANVRWSVKQLAERPGRTELVGVKVQLAGAVYQLDSGVARLLDG
jgi:carbonic anhydrase